MCPIGNVQVRAAAKPHSSDPALLRTQRDIYRRDQTPVHAGDGTIRGLDVRPAGPEVAGRHLDHISARWGAGGCGPLDQRTGGDPRLELRERGDAPCLAGRAARAGGSRSRRLPRPRGGSRGAAGLLRGSGDAPVRADGRRPGSGRLEAAGSGGSQPRRSPHPRRPGAPMRRRGSSAPAPSRGRGRAASVHGSALRQPRVGRGAGDRADLAGAGAGRATAHRPHLPFDAIDRPDETGPATSATAILPLTAK